jgi:hypothetical protein
VWCQFGATMSRFALKGMLTDDSPLDMPVNISDLTVRVDQQTLQFGLASLPPGTIKAFALRGEGAPDDDSQLEEPLYAVVTQFVYDAFDRLRERAIGIHLLDAAGDQPRLGTRVWPDDQAANYSGMHGRLRFLRVLRGKTRARGGFELTPQQFPLDFFGRESDESLDADPNDAAGMAMGISAPLEWGT